MKKNTSDTSYVAISMCLGLSIGIAMKHMILGLCIGAVIGICLEYIKNI